MEGPPAGSGSGQHRGGGIDGAADVGERAGAVAAGRDIGGDRARRPQIHHRRCSARLHPHHSSLIFFYLVLHRLFPIVTYFNKMNQLWDEIYQILAVSY